MTVFGIDERRLKHFGSRDPKDPENGAAVWTAENTPTGAFEQYDPRLQYLAAIQFKIILSKVLRCHIFSTCAPTEHLPLTTYVHPEPEPLELPQKKKLRDSNHFLS